MGVTPTNSPLLTAYVIFFPGGIKVEAVVVDTAASGSVVSKRLGKKLGMVQRASAARISQADGGTLKGAKEVVNSSFKFLISFSFAPLTNRPRLFSPVPINESADFGFNAEVLDIGQRDMMIGLSWLKENDFHIDTRS